MADSTTQVHAPQNSPRRPRNRNRGSRTQNSAINLEPVETGGVPLPRTERHNHRVRGGQSRGGQHTTIHAPSVILPNDTVEPTDLNVGGVHGDSRRGHRGARAGRSRRGRIEADGIPSRQQFTAFRTVQGRQFEGQLSVQNDRFVAPESSETNNPLQANAPVFVPGQVMVPPKESKRAPLSQPKKRRLSKSTAADIASRIHEDITNGNYECGVCTNEVFRNSKVWSCRTCWSVFHLTCAKKWALSDGSTVSQPRPRNGELPAPRQWRCPGCNLPKDDTPKQFTCWCGKELDPRSLPGLPPFSCGQTCSREHILPKSCPHKCTNTCHAGPCPPCPQKGPNQSCFCGRNAITRRCLDTDYENGWSCGEVCGEMMPCGEHFCERSCHEGLCGACEVRVEARCYCGQIEKEIVCCERAEEKLSKRTHISEVGKLMTEEWTGTFDCGEVCKRPFDCGKHYCEKACHVQDAPSTPHCPRSPDAVSHCPCGKTPLVDISIKQRSSCEDGIPSCALPCLKTLPCGHPCQLLCHSGDCPPCLQKVEIRCRCGRTTSKTICHQGIEESPECMRICRVNLNCGRHECGEHCCPGERKAAERTKRKPRPLNSTPILDGFEAEHICTRPCGRLLRCGNHICEELCHKGQCGSCREAVFDEISCNCGRTVLQPPLPCGSVPPPCRFQCERTRDCGHPQVSHNCHGSDEACPKCPFLTTKPCLCGKNQLKNQPCWVENVRCGEICGRKMKCGFHQCQQSCHRPGECEDSANPCQQLCGKEKSCGHPCSDKCHSPFTCKEDKPCQHKILVTCDCQRMKQELKCNAVKNTEGNATKTLKCDDECGRLQRNRKLALALEIDLEAQKDDHIPYQAETLNMYLENTQWAQVQEKALRQFAADPEQRRLRFKPMNNRERSFVHALAEDFGFDSESMDPEPHRHVAVFKTPRFVTAPMKTLAECARIQQTQRAITASTVTEVPKKVKASNVVSDPMNAFLITQTRFGLTIEELRAVVNPILSTSSTIQLDISFLPNEEIVLKPLQRTIVPERALETALTNLKSDLSKAMSTHSLGCIQLCRVDDSLNVLQLESDSANSGWSQVAAKAAAPRRTAVHEYGLPSSKNKFTVFSTATSQAKVVKVKKEQKRERISVEEDWEAAEAREEERERSGLLGNAAATSGDEKVAESDEKIADGVKKVTNSDDKITSGDEKKVAHGDEKATNDDEKAKNDDVEVLGSS